MGWPHQGPGSGAEHSRGSGRSMGVGHTAGASTERPLVRRPSAVATAIPGDHLRLGLAVLAAAGCLTTAVCSTPFRPARM
jgi:hypothetical protein